MGPGQNLRVSGDYIYALNRSKNVCCLFKRWIKLCVTNLLFSSIIRHKYPIIFGSASYGSLEGPVPAPFIGSTPLNTHGVGKDNHNNGNLFLPRGAMHRANYAVVRCLSVRQSVCPLRSCIVSKRVNKFSNFSHYLSPAVPVFFVPNVVTIFRRRRL